MTAALAAVPATAPERRSWRDMLAEAIRPEFGIEVYVPDASDRVLFGALCAVSGCPAGGAHRVKRDHYLCRGHVLQWRKAGEPDIERWVRTGARSLKTLKLAARCEARGCPRSVYQHVLCYPHHGRWQRAGRPDRAAWAARAGAVAVSRGHRCRLTGCRFPAMGSWGFCDTHHMHFAHLRAAEHTTTPGDFLDQAARVRLSSAPRYDLRALPELVRLELQFALQCRHDARRAQLEPIAFRRATRWVAELGVGSLLERSGRFFEHAARERFGLAARQRGCPELAWVRYVRAQLPELRDEHSGIEVWEWDTWTVDRISVDARYAHQPQRRIYFAAIDPPCDHVLTTEEFLPAHREQLARTEQLIPDARTAGRQRIAEMNEPIRVTHGSAPRSPCASWAPRARRSPSRPLPAAPGSRASGSTSNPSCVSRSSACATIGRGRPRDVRMSGRARRRCASALKRCSWRTVASAAKSASCAPSSPSPTASGEKSRSSSPPRARAPATTSLRRVRLQATDPRPGLGQLLVDAVARAGTPAEVRDLLIRPITERYKRGVDRPPATAQGNPLKRSSELTADDVGARPRASCASPGAERHDASDHPSAVGCDLERHARVAGNRDEGREEDSVDLRCDPRLARHRRAALEREGLTARRAPKSGAWSRPRAEAARAPYRLGRKLLSIASLCVPPAR